MLPLSPALTPTWPRRCKVISDMKADRSPEQRHGRVPLSLCRNMEECEQQRPLVILTQADISLMPCFWGCREGCLSSQTLRLHLKNCRALLQWEAWIAPLPSAIWSWSFFFFSVISVGWWTSLQMAREVIAASVFQELNPWGKTMSASILGRLSCLPVKQAFKDTDFRHCRSDNWTTHYIFFVL